MSSLISRARDLSSRAPSSLWTVVPALFATLLIASRPFRGLNLWSVWLLQGAQRFESWFDTANEGTEAAAFAGNGLVFSGPGFLVASLGSSSEHIVVLRLLVLACGFVALWCAGELARDAGGKWAGLAAVVFLACTPRFWAALTVPGPTAFTLGLIPLATLAVWRMRRHWLWAALAIPAMTLAIWSSLYAWLWLGLWFGLTILRFDGSARRGQVPIRPVHAIELVAIPASLILLVVLVPYLHDDTLERLGTMLRTWLSENAEPVIFHGERYGSIRVPFVYAPIFWARILPLPVSFGALSALIFVRGKGRGLRAAPIFTGLFGGWLFIFMLRSGFHAGHDLHALATPFLAAAAGLGWVELGRRASGVDWVSHRMKPLFCAGVVTLALAAAALELPHAWRAPEAYANGLFGRTEGLARDGMSRFAHGPVPLEVVNLATGEGGHVRLAILTNAWELRPVLDTYAHYGLLNGTFELVDPLVADAAIMVYDETLPEYYSVVGDAESLRRSEGSVGWELSSGGMPLVTLFLLPW